MNGAPMTLIDLLVEQHRRAGRGADPAVIEGTTTCSFDDLATMAQRAAGALADAGVGHGDRVVIALADGIDWVRAVLGAFQLGAVAVPLDHQSPPERIADVCDDCGPALIVATEDGEHPEGIPRLGPEAVAAWEDVAGEVVSPDDLAYLIYSSGSTGRPKAAMHTHADPGVSVDTYATEILGLGPGDRCFSVPRLFTSLGFGNGFFRPLGRGATAVLDPLRPNVRTVLRVVAEGRVTVLTGVPTFWSQLARFLSRRPDPDALRGVRLAVSSGDALPPTVAESIVAQTSVDIIDGLGCSECSNTFISWRPGEFLPGLLGRVVGGVEVRLADDDGTPVEQGDSGRLWIRSASNTSGYWRRPELTEELVRGEWLRMNDLLCEVEPGLYRHVGRADEMFKVDARWVSPAAVEAALLEHPDVIEAAVIGRADEQGLLRPCAFVVGPERADAGVDRELRAHVVERLAPFSAPEWVIVRDALPRLASGKLDRRALSAAVS